MASTLRPDRVKYGMSSERVVFNGVTYRRYPESDRRESRLYFSCSPSCSKNGIRRLHQAVWRATHGDIPKGCHIHHVDGNTLNNAIENLECVTPLRSEEHTSELQSPMY